MGWDVGRSSPSALLRGHFRTLITAHAEACLDSEFQEGQQQHPSLKRKSLIYTHSPTG